MVIIGLLTTLKYQVLSLLIHESSRNNCSLLILYTDNNSIAIVTCKAAQVFYPLCTYWASFDPGTTGRCPFLIAFRNTTRDLCPSMRDPTKDSLTNQEKEKKEENSLAPGRINDLRNRWHVF